MDVQKRDRFREVTPKRDAVVDIHELRRDEPDGEATILKPIVAQKQKITIKSSETADVSL